MKIEITNRMRGIIDLINRYPDISLNEIAQNLNISIRQVRYDIAKINDMIGDVAIITNQKGRILIHSPERIQQFLKKEKSVLCFTKEQRLKLLSAIIAFRINLLNLNQLAKRLDVTRATIKNDMRDVEADLQAYRLQLHYKEKFMLIGSTDDIYEYQMVCLGKLEVLYTEHSEAVEETLSAYISEIFPLINFKGFVLALRNFIKRETLLLNDSEYSWLLRVIILAIWYYQKDGSIPPYKNNLKNIKIIDYHYEILFDELQAAIYIPFDDKLQYILKEICSVIKVDSVNDEDDILQTQALIFVTNMVLGLDETYRFYYEKDCVFLAAIYNHILNVFKRKNYDVNVSVLKDYQIPLPKTLKSYIEAFMTQYNEQYHCFDLYDIQMVELHFANYFRWNSVKQTKALLICGVSRYHSWMLKKQLESFFEIEIIDIIPKYEISLVNNTDGIDLILSTEDILEYSMLKYPLIKINYVLGEEDFIKIYTKGVRLRQFKEREWKEINQNQLVELTADAIYHHTFQKDPKFNIVVENQELKVKEKTQHLFDGLFIYVHAGKNNHAYFERDNDRMYLDIETNDFVSLCMKLIAYGKMLKQL